MKALPCYCSKGRLQKHICGGYNKDLALSINEVISENRKISIEDAKKLTNVRKNECYKIMVEFGELPDEINNNV